MEFLLDLLGFNLSFWIKVEKLLSDLPKKKHLDGPLFCCIMLDCYGMPKECCFSTVPDVPLLHIAPVPHCEHKNQRHIWEAKAMQLVIPVINPSNVQKVCHNIPISPQVCTHSEFYSLPYLQYISFPTRFPGHEVE